jgi:hypothetical protein
MPIAKSRFIKRMLACLGDAFAEHEGQIVTKWAVVAVCGLLAVCAEIGEAAARGRYSNFGPWSSNHSQVTEISATPRPNEHGAAKPLLRANGHHRPVFHGHPQRDQNRNALRKFHKLAKSTNLRTDGR